MTEAILGASTFKGTEATKRGQKLEPEVLAEVFKAKNIKITASGLLLNPKFPISGASPDEVSDVIEVKCPSKPENVKQCVKNGKPKPKVQMFLQRNKPGFFVWPLLILKKIYQLLFMMFVLIKKHVTYYLVLVKYFGTMLYSYPVLNK